MNVQLIMWKQLVYNKFKANTKWDHEEIMNALDEIIYKIIDKNTCLIIHGDEAELCFRTGLIISDSVQVESEIIFNE